MNVFQTRIQILSGIETPLTAATLWGHICWGIRYRQGERTLEDWLSQYDTDFPPLVMGTPQPEGFWPTPLIPQVVSENRSPTKEEYDQRKQIKRRSLLDLEPFRKLISELSAERLLESIRTAEQSSRKPPKSVSESVLHAAINRYTGGTAGLDGGTLFSVNSQFFADRPIYSVISLSPEPASTIQQWFEDGLLGGYGRNASSGRGHLKVISVDPISLPVVNQPNAVMILSPIVASPTDPLPIFGRTQVHAGRVGAEFANGSLPNGSSIRQKKPVIMLATGSILESNSPSNDKTYQRQWVGSVPQNVHPEWNQIRHYGMAPVIGVKLAQSLHPGGNQEPPR